MKKVTIILGLLLMMMALPTMAFAETVEDYGEWEVISWDEIPADVQPVRVESIEEANRLINNLQMGTVANVNSHVNMQMAPNSIAASGTNAVQSKRNGGPMIGTYFNVEIRYNYSGNCFTSCNNISSYLTGITSYVSWVQTDDWYSFAQGNTVLKTHVAGDLTSYVISGDFPLRHTDHYSDIQTDFTV